MADETKDGGPAFPRTGRVEGRLEHDHYGKPLPGWRPYTLGGGEGMSLRDYFAAAALPKCLEEFWGQSDEFTADGARTYAEAAYQIADAMLAERSRR